MQKAVSFNQNSRRADALEGELYSSFHLFISDNHPMNIRGTRVPVSTRVFVGGVGLLETRSDERFIAELAVMASGNRAIRFPKRPLAQSRMCTRRAAMKRAIRLLKH